MTKTLILIPRIQGQEVLDSPVVKELRPKEITIVNRFDGVFHEVTKTLAVFSVFFPCNNATDCSSPQHSAH